ncbi:hypothetical protein O181_037449 [Austropuccinia psidii MF-1]|uniref:Retrovirus-related Pol polyprotein from transposon TNT 1-94-like beta-barrel domain-containing protein n=1 Tax=Austropuccinia psidii MF-1 TaxID=1389203 RepID=A0A9Q3D6E8_9BASI|nr:hypothetical protein [Austropuccinia psidii MF-1]
MLYLFVKETNQPPLAHLSTAQALANMKNFIIPNQELIIDCGATHHMFNSEHIFVSLVKVSTGDPSSSLFSEGTGTVDIILKGKVFNLEKCLFVPRLNFNLISLLELNKNKITINRQNNQFTLETSGKI